MKYKNKIDITSVIMSIITKLYASYNLIVPDCDTFIAVVRMYQYNNTFETQYRSHIRLRSNIQFHKCWAYADVTTALFSFATGVQYSSTFYTEHKLQSCKTKIKHSIRNNDITNVWQQYRQGECQRRATCTLQVN